MNNEGEILDFTYRPKSDKKSAKLIMLVLLVFSAGVVIASVVSPLYKGVISLLAVISLMVAVYIFVRFVMSDYAYAIYGGEEGDAKLVVTRAIGKRVTTLSSISLISIDSIMRAEGEPNRERFERKYNFCQSFSPKLQYVLRVRTRYEKFTVHLEITDEVAQRLLSYIDIAKANQTEE